MSCSDEDLLGIADGLAEMATREGVTIAGGDLVRCPVLVVSVTAVGYEPGGSPLRHAGRAPGPVTWSRSRASSAARPPPWS